MKLNQKLPRGAAKGLPANTLWTIEPCDNCGRLVTPRQHEGAIYAYCTTCRKASTVAVEASKIAGFQVAVLVPDAHALVGQILEQLRKVSA